MMLMAVTGETQSIHGGKNGQLEGFVLAGVRFRCSTVVVIWILHPVFVEYFHSGA